MCIYKLVSHGRHNKSGFIYLLVLSLFKKGHNVKYFCCNLISGFIQTKTEVVITDSYLYLLGDNISYYLILHIFLQTDPTMRIYDSLNVSN